MEIRSRRNRSNRSGHLYLYNPGTLPGRVAVRWDHGGSWYRPRHGTMKRPFRLAVLAMLAALPVVTQLGTPLVTRVAAQLEPASPGRGQTLADTLAAIQQAR